ncbi:Predicted hydrolase of the alpha/beta superfamily [Sinomicrobium oceani]|uniref:Predicted hydrolase of the alpha/beta superfamily n=2 Tax=Sinomicrobium oceani TaxID=1150368 RepID=A0A1K1M433_9FLAO|nr:Predicted hydrolase of the alpha/beta superfamily [Sinomicrobium oceani]
MFSFLAFTQEEPDPDAYYAVSETIFIESEVYKKQRELQIFIPDEYFWEKNRHFKVLYLFDAQNTRIFNYISGNIQLLSMNTIEPVIIVGIVTEDRWDEFLPPNNHVETLKRYEPPMGHADLLIQHIQEEVEPFLKKNYRVQDYRLGIGHSLGATFVTYASMKTDNLFDYNILLSPNYNYDQKQFVDRYKEFVGNDLEKNKTFYFTNGCGDRYENEFDGPLQEVIAILEDSGNEKIKWEYKKTDIDNHGLIWLAVCNGLLHWNAYMTKEDK